MLPTILIHGWSVTSESLQNLSQWLQANGFPTIDIYLADYLSMNDEVTLQDIGFAFRRALEKNNISQSRYSFNVITHSTGGLVAREYLRQICAGDVTKTPILHLLQFAPANFGSPLAKLGKSMMGRLMKGWSWDHVGQSGKNVLDALELASPYTWQLAQDDLFDPNFRIFSTENTMVTVIVGTAAYQGIQGVLHENGSDGTVRVSTANLNAHMYTLDFTNPQAPLFQPTALNCGHIAHAVFHCNHSSIKEPEGGVPAGQTDSWRKTVFDALTIGSSDYQAHAARCEEIKESTFREGLNGENPDWYHRYQHVVFRVHDQFGQPIDDYFVEFYQEENDAQDEVFIKMQQEILEQKTTNQVNPSYRSFLFDTTDLRKYLDSNSKTIVKMSMCAANISERIAFRNPPNTPNAGIDAFGSANRQFIFPDEPVLVDVILYRDPREDVFRLRKA